MRDGRRHSTGLASHDAGPAPPPSWTVFPRGRPRRQPVWLMERCPAFSNLRITIAQPEYCVRPFGKDDFFSRSWLPVRSLPAGSRRSTGLLRCCCSAWEGQRVRVTSPAATSARGGAATLGGQAPRLRTDVRQMFAVRQLPWRPMPMRLAAARVDVPPASAIKRITFRARLCADRPGGGQAQ
jgi:hypothetical protein